MSPKVTHPTHQRQTDDIDIEFLKNFTDYIKTYNTKKKQRANSIFTNDVFSIIYSYTIYTRFEKKTQNESPTQTSAHSTVRQEICTFSKFLYLIRDSLTSNEISKNI